MSAPRAHKNLWNFILRFTVTSPKSGELPPQLATNAVLLPVRFTKIGELPPQLAKNLGDSENFHCEFIAKLSFNLCHHSLHLSCGSSFAIIICFAYKDVFHANETEGNNKWLVTIQVPVKFIDPIVIVSVTLIICQIQIQCVSIQH